MAAVVKRRDSGPLWGGHPRAGAAGKNCSSTAIHWTWHTGKASATAFRAAADAREWGSSPPPPPLGRTGPGSGSGALGETEDFSYDPCYGCRAAGPHPAAFISWGRCL